MNEFFNNISTLEELKKEYRRLSMIHHPDLGGDVETMKLLNAEYDRLVRSGHFAKEMDDTNTTEDETILFKDIIEGLIALHGLVIEICGSWLWVSGETYKHKVIIKALGLKFASKKKMWFWRPEETASNNRNQMDMDEIRARHGSKIVSSGFCPAKA